MLPESIRLIIREEQARQGGRFINVGIDDYLAKLDAHAELVADFIEDRCRGFVAYYCNDRVSKTAFVTLVLVNPLDRGQGLGQALIKFVLSVAKTRGFIACRLEVHASNRVAFEMYESLGFMHVDTKGEMNSLEVVL
jgi:ribosomal protein S18 acetylase RimI-like enzyme